MFEQHETRLPFGVAVPIIVSPNDMVVNTSGIPCVHVPNNEVYIFVRDLVLARQNGLPVPVPQCPAQQENQYPNSTDSPTPRARPIGGSIPPKVLEEVMDQPGSSI